MESFRRPLKYYRDLRAYGDGKHLYVTRTGIKKMWGINPIRIRNRMRRAEAECYVVCNGGINDGRVVPLYRRDKVRKRLDLWIPRLAGSEVMP